MTTTTVAGVTHRDSALASALSATSAMTLVGSSAAVLAVLDDYPTFGGQAIRYAGAAGVLILVMRARRLPLSAPPVRDLVRLVALATVGLAGFNVCFMQAVRHAEPSTVGAVIGGVPVLLAVAGAVGEGRLPSPRVVGAAAAITVGIALMQGFGGGSLTGLLWAGAALLCEVAFSLLAVPLLPGLGPLRVSAHASALAVPLLLVAGVVADGAGAVRVPTPSELAALSYLAVMVTALAFLLWYTAVGALGADRAGLFAGIAPVSAVAATVVVGSGRPGLMEAVGGGVVACGIAWGLSGGRSDR